MCSPDIDIVHQFNYCGRLVCNPPKKKKKKKKKLINYINSTTLICLCNIPQYKLYFIPNLKILETAPNPFMYDNFSFHKFVFFRNDHLHSSKLKFFSSFSSKARLVNLIIYLLLEFCLFKVVFCITIFTSRFLIPSSSICILFLFDWIENQ